MTLSRMNSDHPGGSGGLGPSGAVRLGDSGEHAQGRTGPMPGKSPRVNQGFFELQKRVQGRLATELESNKVDLSSMSPAHSQRTVEEYLHRIIDSETQKQGMPLSTVDRKNLFQCCVDDIVGYGPIEPLLRDDDVSEIMINGPHSIYVEYKGNLVKTEFRFQDDDHVMRVLEKIVGQINRRIDESSPMVDARLRDGSRVNAIIPPVSLDGPIVTIRKFSRRALQPRDLVAMGSLTEEMVLFLEACVRANLNIIISGGTGSGKTTLLNVLSVFIPGKQRIVTIEDSAELQLQQDHVVRMESRPASVEGKNEITIRRLVANSLRMRPDRIIIGECRGGEALDMLVAMNTGHEGSMTTIHANSAKDVLSRLEMLVLQARELPTRAIREQVANAVHLIVHADHLEDGTRRVTSISELRRGASDNIEIVDIFAFERAGVSPEGKVLGRLRAIGTQPRVIDLLEKRGQPVPPSLFQR